MKKKAKIAFGKLDLLRNDQLNNKNKIKIGFVGGGPNSFIGYTHRLSARFDDRFEFVDKQENRIGNYETKGQVLVAWKDDYLATKKVNVNTIGELNLVPKIKKLDKDEFVSYIDETYIGGITIRGRGEVQKIEPPRNQFSFGPFIGVAYNGATGLTEPIVGVGVSYNLIKVWDWR